MHSRGSAFLKIRIAFANFKDSGKIQVTKDWLMRLEIVILIVLEYFLKSLVGILLGSIDILRFNVLIMSSTSLPDFEVKKKVFSDRFVR